MEGLIPETRIKVPGQLGMGVVMAAAFRESKLEEEAFYSNLQVRFLPVSSLRKVGAVGS